MTRNVALKQAIFEEKTTQREVAREAGIPENQLSLAIHGRFILDPIQKGKIAQVLGRKVDELFR